MISRLTPTTSTDAFATTNGNYWKGHQAMRMRMRLATDLARISPNKTIMQDCSSVLVFASCSSVVHQIFNEGIMMTPF